MMILFKYIIVFTILEYFVLSIANEFNLLLMTIQKYLLYDLLKYICDCGSSNLIPLSVLCSKYISCYFLA